MNRFYVSPESILSDKVIISERETLHHLRDVLRLEVNDALVAFDGKGRECFGFLEKISFREATVRIKEIRQSCKETEFNVTLAIAIPKKKRMDYLIEKCTELGVDTIIPLKTERTVVDIKEDSEAGRINRWEKLAIEAAEQSGRVFLPEIRRITAFQEALRQVKDYDLSVLFCLEAKERKSLPQALSGFKGVRILAFVGPEGDFTPEEIYLAQEAGCVFGSLGKTVLKVDTAAIAIMAVLSLAVRSQ